MKRIDDKIKEIEKNDKRNRIKYIGFILIIGAFIAYAIFSEQAKKKMGNTIDVQKGTIEVQKGTIAEQLKQAIADKDSIQGLYIQLSNSMVPDDYWNYIKNQGSNEAYINFIVNKFKIDKSKYLPIAIKTLTTSDLDGFKGWLWCGLKKNDGIYTSQNIVEVFYRDGAEVTDNVIKKSEPKIGDIVKLIDKTNRNTYRFNKRRGQNEQGFRNKTRAFVSNVWKDPNSWNFEIEIKYY